MPVKESGENPVDLRDRAAGVVLAGIVTSPAFTYSELEALYTIISPYETPPATVIVAEEPPPPPPPDAASINVYVPSPSAERT